MNSANENDVAKIIHAMDEEFMRLLAARDIKQLTANFYACVSVKTLPWLSTIVKWAVRTSSAGF
jgi:hypothetical protein